MSTGEKEDRGNRWVLRAFSVYRAADDVFLGVYRPHRVLDARRRYDALGGRGGVLVRGPWCALFRCYVLKNRFSGLVAIQAGHKLETHGIYGLIRNPSYLGMLVNFAGLGAGIPLASWACCWWHRCWFRWWRACTPRSGLLREHFGAEYEAYFKRTWRLVPGIY